MSEQQHSEFVESEQGSLEYFWDEDEKVWVLWDISSQKPGEGKKIIKKFAAKVGPNQLVRAPITEEITLARLSELGVFSFVSNRSRAVELTSPALFKSLKITRMLAGGGIEVEKIVVTPQKLTHADGQTYSAVVDIRGHTK